MIQSIEAMIDEKGMLRFLEPIILPKSRRVIVTILDEEPSEDSFNLALLSEAALAKDWLRPEEDEAWSELAQLPLPEPVELPKKRRQPGSAKGILAILSEDEEHLDDFREYMP